MISCGERHRQQRIANTDERKGSVQAAEEKRGRTRDIFARVFFETIQRGGREKAKRYSIMRLRGEAESKRQQEEAIACGEQAKNSED